jgi:hypothetical protein
LCIIILEPKERIQFMVSILFLNTQTCSRSVAENIACFQKCFNTVSKQFNPITIRQIPWFFIVKAQLASAAVFFHGFDAELKFEVFSIIVPTVKKLYCV